MVSRPCYQPNNGPIITAECLGEARSRMSLFLNLSTKAGLALSRVVVNSDISCSRGGKNKNEAGSCDSKC